MYYFKDVQIYVLIEDITTMEVDVIVNSANISLLKGSGLCGAIYKKAGIINLEQECLKYAPLETGKAILTSGYNLPCKKIIHTVAPKWFLEEDDRKEKLSNCYVNIMKITEENKFSTLAIPCIGMGIYKCPLEIGSSIAIKNVLNYLKENYNSLRNLQKIFFVCSNKEQFDMYNEVIKIKLEEQ